MSKVTVTRQFKEDFDLWAEQAIRYGDFTADDMVEFRGLLRQDFQPGPDQLRQGLTFITDAGLEVPAMIDNYEDRIRVWTVYFADKAQTIRQRTV